MKFTANTTEAFLEKLSEIAIAAEEGELSYDALEIPLNCTGCNIVHSSYDDDEWWRAKISVKQAKQYEDLFAAKFEIENVYSRKLVTVENRVYGSAAELVKVIVAVAGALMVEKEYLR